MSRPMHSSVVQAIQEIDAAVMNGDTFHDKKNREELLEYIERWKRELAEDAEDEETEST